MKDPISPPENLLKSGDSNPSEDHSKRFQRSNEAGDRAE